MLASEKIEKAVKAAGKLEAANCKNLSATNEKSLIVSKKLNAIINSLNLDETKLEQLSNAIDDLCSLKVEAGRCLGSNFAANVLYGIITEEA